MFNTSKKKSVKVNTGQAGLAVTNKQKIKFKKHEIQE
jgi:hypothetical protein